ncbi:MAG TPA: alkaline phosphatase family protein [Chthoniobacterales bacterium]|nr:alkaline phosphatase family protein [Chthoniobacterales bacterium]
MSSVQHIIWVWFENRESSAITAATAPYFASFALAHVNFTNFYGITHPSQPNYLDAYSGSAQGVTGDGYATFPAAVDNLANQLNAAGKSWRVYAQNYPGGCSDVQTFADGLTDGPGVTGTYVRKHNPAISFENVRLNPAQCANIQRLANFDPTVNVAFVVPNMINDMHDGTTAQGDAFLQAFVPLVTASPDWAHTLLIVSFDEGTTSVNGGGHIYTAAAAPWLAPATVGTTYNHFNVLRTIEEVYGLPFLGSAATATAMTELLPAATTPTPTPTATPTPTPRPSPTPTPSPGPATHLEVVAPSEVIMFNGFNFTVRALDRSNNTVTGYTGTVHFTTTSQQALLPPDGTLTNGFRTFSADLQTIGIQTITATDTVNASITGTSNDILVRSDQPPTPTATATPTSTPSATPAPSTPTPTATPTSTPTPTATPASTSTATPSSTATPTNTPAPTATPSPTPAAASRAVNLSTRMKILTGDNVGIGGFIITGTGTKHVLIRALGPSLSQFGVPDPLADPVLELHGSSGFVAIVNDNWKDDPVQSVLIEATGLQPTNDFESAIEARLDPGQYTAVASGKNNTTGVGLIEVYDLAAGDLSKLGNISTRAFVSTGNDIVIAGFILGGNNSAPDRVIVRGIGPSLVSSGVTNPLSDPTLELRDNNGSLLFANNDWQENSAQAKELINAGLAPTNNLESAIAATLPPGLYTALLAGANNGTGVGLVEVYDRGP